VCTELYDKNLRSELASNKLKAITDAVLTKESKTIKAKNNNSHSALKR
jgi:hypothetical protein